MVVVLGIDPGTANTGYGVVVARGARLGALERRLVAIHERVLELIEEHQPVAVGIEELYFGQNVRTASAVGQARGAVLLAAGQTGIPCFSYTPQQIKQAVCGSGAAAKDQVQRMVAALLSLPEPPRPDHAADALAVAICHANTAPLRASIASDPGEAAIAVKIRP